VHYDLDIVKKELFDYCKDRWIALQGKSFIRHDAKGEPLYFKNIDDVSKYIKIYNARTIYATAAVYSNIKYLRISRYTPFFDIDTKIDKWELAVEAAKIIVDALEKEGVKESVYIIWSGEGMHVRINENALPKNIDPLLASKVIVNYILKKTNTELEKLVNKSQGDLKVENLIDDKRLFTAPLSLHRNLEYVAICLSTKDLNNFSLEWARPENFKHNISWRNYVENEIETLCKIAIKEFDTKVVTITKNSEMKPQSLKIGRFQIMGLLQAARYYVLHNDSDKAKSFGINRAIFYAWAKHYGKSYSSTKGHKAGVASEQTLEQKIKNVAGEEVYIDDKTGFFIIGNKPNFPKDFDKEIKDKINAIYPFEEAWRAAVEYVSSFSRETLLDQRKFFEKVYLPVRDNFEKILKKEGLSQFLEKTE